MSEQTLRNAIGNVITAYMVDDGKNVASCERAVDDAIDTFVAERDRAVYLAEHLFMMIPKELWREQGAEYMGQYEGDHWAEQTWEEIKQLKRQVKRVYWGCTTIAGCDTGIGGNMTELPRELDTCPECMGDLAEITEYVPEETWKP